MQELLTTSEAAQILNVNERHVRQLIEAGTIKARRVGRSYQVIAASLKNYTKHPTMGRPKADKSA